MTTPGTNRTQDTYPATRAICGTERWQAVMADCGDHCAPDAVLAALAAAGHDGLPEYLPELVRLEWTFMAAGDGRPSIPRSVDSLTVNPTVRILELGWQGLSNLIDQSAPPRREAPRKGLERILLWFDPRRRGARAEPATNEDLLALKMIMEGIPAEAVAAQGRLPVGAVDEAMDRAIRRGIVLAPPSRLVRDPSVFTAVRAGDEQFISTSSFTLQWHITQVCDLHCKHCYDRTERSPLSLDRALRVLDDMRGFCKNRNVQGAVSFTGGNPLLHPHFLDIYRAAVERGFSTAILGNPAPRERIEKIISISMPSFFQVSLEGLREQNDDIRGAGHFDRIISFLQALKELQVYSMVMLTLTSDNMDQVLPLAAFLRGKTDVFHFNRLALFGEGARLQMPDRARYRQFLREYLAAAEHNPVMGIKDNLINILRHEQGRDLFGGCAGYGCGAAFNFVSLLADGEVHACRKLPSSIGNINHQSLADIYDSDQAKQYRRGPAACIGCPVRPACGGCLAAAKSHGLDIFEEKDPFCFLSR